MGDSSVTTIDGPGPPWQRLGELLGLFLRLGTFGFGGPNAHIAIMEEEAVRRRRWLSREHFVDILAVTNMLPGPNSTEMGIHLGYLRAGLPGAVLSGLAFILPAFFLLLGLSWAYFEHGTLLRVDALFYGVKPAAIAIILITVYRTGSAAISDGWQAGLFGAGLALTLLFPSVEPITLLLAGLAGILIYATPNPFRGFPAAAILLTTAPPLLSWQGETLIDLSLLFLRTGGLLFGGGYVMIPLIEHDVVERFGWMSRQEFLAGVALGQATPGPIIITATFVGYKAAGLAGAAVATAAIFVPSFVISVTVARFVSSLRQWPLARAFLRGVGPAVVGAILAAAIILAREALTDALTVLLMLAALVALGRYRIGFPYVFGVSAAVGLLTKEVF